MRATPWSRGAAGPRGLLPLLVLPVLVVGASCGGDRLDRSQPLPVFEAALAAFARADLPAVLALCTERGRTRLEADLRSFQQALGDAERAPETIETMRRLGRTAAPAEVERAARGSLGDALGLYVAVQPVPLPPERVSVEGDPAAGSVRVLWHRGFGEERAWRLVRQEGAWAVDHLAP